MSQPAPPIFERSAYTLSGVGPRLGEKLARLGVETIGDLLCLLPNRYEDRTSARPLGTLRPGEKVLVRGEIALAEVVFRRRRVLLVRLVDGTGSLTLRFFHFSRAQQEGLARGAVLECFGEVRAGPTGLEMVHPEYRAASRDSGEPSSDRLTPVYPTTEGLHQARLRRLVAQALDMLDEGSIEDVLARYLPAGWPSLEESLRCLHEPPRDVDRTLLAQGRHASQRRMAVEELVAHRLSLRGLAARAADQRAPQILPDPARLARLRGALPFELTDAQNRSLEEILADLGKSRPMHRLLQGDVGSGKTVVAGFAMYAAALGGCQAALMAPTEILAEQHLVSLRRWLGPLGLDVVLLTGSQKGAERRGALDEIADGRAAIVVGTHALFQEHVAFHRLGLVIVDEQHRFGVDQRLRLQRKGSSGGVVPHQLVMTATPIPRTLAMTAYADLDFSVIDALPAGRKPVQTVAMPERRRAELVHRVAEHCAGGAQAYWVCPLIEESEAIDTSAALELERELREALPQLSLGLIHGRMRPGDKDAVMRRFKQGEIDLLVATTVIEVGVDVPNASLMVIENAERMGLAQLHQLRGRVGRGEARSTCVLLYKPPLSEVARERIDVMRRTTDGFAIAQKDLELRGPGEVLGTRQTGLQELRIADLIRDADLLPMVVEVADRLASDQPGRVDALVRRWIKAGSEYAQV